MREKNREGVWAAGQVRPDPRLGDVGALVRAAQSLQPGNPPTGDAIARKRQLVAMFCKMLGEQMLEEKPLPPCTDPLSPRERQTLELLLCGNAEKQVAGQLAISRHTVHVYVKSLYKRFGVSSRSELLAKWVQH